MKLWLRQAVLGADAWVGFDIFVLSFPNYVEAIVGVSSVSGLLLLARIRGFANLKSYSDRTIIIVAGLLAAFYVLTQEFGLHNLGGNNVIDVYDAIASVIGLAMTVLIYLRYGFFEQDE